MEIMQAKEEKRDGVHLFTARLLGGRENGL